MKRLVRWFAIVATSLVVLYLIALGILSIQPTVNDADLRPRREPLAADQNAFPILEQAAAKAWWPDQQNLALSDLARNTNWNAALAAEALANNREALKLFDDAVKLWSIQVPESRLVTDELPYLSGWKRLAQVAAIRANAEFHAGREAEAFQRALELVRLGREMQAAGGTVIHYLVGIAVQGIGLERMRDWVGRSHLSAPQLVDLVAELDRVPRDGGPVVETLKAEYQTMMNTMLELRAGRLVLKGEDGTMQRYVPIKYVPLYNHGKTKRLFANATRQLIQCVEVPYSQAKRPDFDHRPTPVKLVLSGNVAGEVYFWMVMPSVVMVVSKRGEGNVQLQTTRVLLALRAYQLKHGRLPDRLEALMPEFIPAIPEDAFNGEPLRYLPEQRVIYSVGENLRDDGGSILREGGRRALDSGCAVGF
jgi:hypothetical protein